MAGISAARRRTPKASVRRAARSGTGREPRPRNNLVRLPRGPKRLGLRRREVEERRQRRSDGRGLDAGASARRGRRFDSGLRLGSGSLGQFQNEGLSRARRSELRQDETRRIPLPGAGKRAGVPSRRSGSRAAPFREERGTFDPVTRLVRASTCIQPATRARLRVQVPTCIKR